MRVAGLDKAREPAASCTSADTVRGHRPLFAAKRRQPPQNAPKVFCGESAGIRHLSAPAQLIALTSDFATLPKLCCPKTGRSWEDRTQLVNRRVVNTAFPSAERRPWGLPALSLQKHLRPGSTFPWRHAEGPSSACGRCCSECARRRAASTSCSRGTATAAAARRKTGSGPAA